MSDKTNDKTNKKKTENKKTKINLITGDCVQEMAKLDENSIDAIVTDPPYGLKFMGKEFDNLGEGAKQKEWHKAWAVEALRVLKPGGHLLAFGGTRTYHHLATAVEEAGFEVRDQMQWLYGSGFPKSHNVGKAIDRKRDDLKDVLKVVNWFCEQLETSGKKRSEIDKAFGTKNVAQYWFSPHRNPTVPTLDKIEILLEVIGVKPEEVPEDIARLLLDLNGKKGQPGENWFKREVVGKDERKAESSWLGTQTDKNKGWGIGKWDLTAPATEEAARWEGWGTALKPANEPIVVARKPFKGTVAENVLEHGTGAINIDGCRVGTTDKPRMGNTDRSNCEQISIDFGSGWQKSGTTPPEGRWPANIILDEEAGELLDEQSGIKEGPARFFYCPKAGKKERNAGLDGFEEKKADIRSDKAAGLWKDMNTPQKNHHPTVKPVALMAYLIRLVTPPGGTVLDPFLGSGSTGLAAIEEETCAGFIGIEKDPEYIKIAKARIEHWQKEETPSDEK